jgi:hypothetical protein
MISSESAIDFYRSLEESIQDKVIEIDKIVDKMGVDLEGNCFYHGKTKLTDWRFLYKRVNYANVMRDFEVKRMLEIGFNAGHSSIVFLEAMRRDGEYISFDLGEHPYSRPCFDYLQTQYPQRKEYIMGDSRKTLPEFLFTHPEYVESFDCVHIDGGHSEDVFVSDIQYAHVCLKSKGILILDDTQLPEISQRIPILLSNGYSFVNQIPTFGFSHIILQKP